MDSPVKRTLLTYGRGSPGRRKLAAPALVSVTCTGRNRDARHPRNMFARGDVPVRWKTAHSRRQAAIAPQSRVLPVQAPRQL